MPSPIAPSARRPGELDTGWCTKDFAVIPLINDQFVFVRGANVEGPFVNTRSPAYYDLATISVKH